MNSEKYSQPLGQMDQKELVEFFKVYVKGSLVLTVRMISDSTEDGNLQVNKVLQKVLHLLPNESQPSCS